jgi:diguanylate cyclase (GGDEF)-like protein
VVRPAARTLVSPHRAWIVTAPLALTAALLTVPVVQQLHSADGFNLTTLFGSLPTLIVLFALLTLSTMVSLNVNVGRETIETHITELPFIMALFYLPPLGVLLIRVVAQIVHQAVRRNDIVKTSFNAAAVAAGTACANAVVAGFGYGRDLSPKGWLMLATAVAVNYFINMAAMTSLMALIKGVPDLPQVIRAFRTGVISTAVNITLGLVTLLALGQTLWSALLLGGLAIGLTLIYRVYAQFVNQHKSLQEIHEITRATSASVTEGRLADVVLGRLRALVSAESATLWLPARGRFPEVLLTATLDHRGLLDRAITPAAVRRRAYESGEPVTVGARLPVVKDMPDLRAELRRLGAKDVIVVPLRSGKAVIGTLEVAGRLGGSVAHFTIDDVRVVETLAAHIGVAVENSRLVDRLRYDANYDSLTGLPNRRRLLAVVGEAIRSRAPDEVIAVIQFDVVDLRDVNESLGHRAGNEVLAEVASRLRSLAPPAALVGRVGGDEFAVTVRAPDLDAAVALADSIRVGLREPMQFDSIAVDVDTTAGVAVNPDHGDDPEMLLQRADVATHAAKHGAGSLAYTPGLESRSVRRLELAADLRRSLDRREIEVYFQPKVALADRRVVGVECLARWDHPVYGSVAPQDFVAVAEHTGQIAQLTELVLRQALYRARQWADDGRALSVSINVSPRSLADPRWPDRVAELIHEYGVRSDQLILEVGEAALLRERNSAVEALGRLRAIGVRLSVDDFGTGYSSLALLRQLPISEVKIDKEFVQGMATDPGELAIVRAVVDLSRHFDLAVVAEGVESELTLTRLEEIGCDIGQGFLFSRPLPSERLDAWLRARTVAQPAKGGEVRWLRAVP